MSVATALQHYMEHRSHFVLVGLTGRTGSGCTTTAKLLGMSFESLRLNSVFHPCKTAEERKFNIIRQYLEKKWDSFYLISVTQVIASFVLDCSLEQLQSSIIFDNIKQKDHEEFLQEFQKVRSEWQKVSSIVKPPLSLSGKEREISHFLDIWNGDIRNFVLVVRKLLLTKFAPVFQAIGDNIRKSGFALDDNINTGRFYALPARVCDIAVAIRHLNETKNLATRVVIDALRNPFEIQYYRDRFAGFFLLAVTTNDEDRKTRLHPNMSDADIKKLDDKEYPSENKPLDGYDQFVSQNIQACLEKADIFVNNPGQHKVGQDPNLSPLTNDLTKFVALMMHPGLVTPTKIERCMQLAYTAKVNSGCISRQVGAVVTDEHFSIKSVGWNDVPEGQIPCLLRDSNDLIESRDQEAFSNYEYRTTKFLDHVRHEFANQKRLHEHGLRAPFCFKSQYNSLENKAIKGGNQVHTRSLHAEENAFLQLAKYGGPGVFKGILFTTASPCELCAKKAYQLGIKEIYYIDPYPGISLSHILESGPNSERRPAPRLYSGAVGSAFYRLYAPLLPFKDAISTFMMDN